MAVVQIGDVTVRLLPPDSQKLAIDWIPGNESDKPESEWKSARTSATGWPLPSAKGDSLDKFYTQLGFDPLTMTEADMKRLQAKADAEWRASVPGSPLNKREQKVLLQFCEHGPNVVVDWTKVKGTGIETEERLTVRGFLEVRYIARDPDRIEGYVLTDAGYAAMQKLLDEARRP